MTNPHRFISDDLAGGKEIPFQPLPKGEITRETLNLPVPPLTQVEITKENLEAIEAMSPEELDERVALLLDLGAVSVSAILSNYRSLRSFLVDNQRRTSLWIRNHQIGARR
jgi:hypothetical protein